MTDYYTSGEFAKRAHVSVRTSSSLQPEARVGPDATVTLTSPSSSRSCC